MRLITCCVLILFNCCIVSCTNEKPHTWYKHFNNIGTYSSPRVIDLTSDGIPDIIMGAGGKEEEYSDTAVIAMNSLTGEVLWALPGYNQYVGSAIFEDINNDKIPDVFIGGRWAQLTAINGADGKPIWTFFPQRPKPDASDSGWYNFTTPQFVADQDGDGIADLLIANGGNPRAPAHDPNRPTGRLVVISGATGKVLANVSVPDGKETYMSVICVPEKNGDVSVLFGTGGETIGGHLYRTKLSNIMRGDISSAKILANNEAKGFVSSPVVVDINKDGIKDIVVDAVDGKMLALDGTTDSLLWEVSFPNSEAYTIPAVGYFTADIIPDFFTSFAIGEFPNLPRSIRCMVNGRTGKPEYIDTIPSFQYASPVTADLNDDGFDEVIINQSALKRKQFENVYYSFLQVFDFKNRRQYPLGDTLPATNLASTPWIGDLDGDGKFDIIYSAVKYQGVRFDLEKPLGLFVGVYRTQFAVKKPVVWGAFMGSDYSGVFGK